MKKLLIIILLGTMFLSVGVAMAATEIVPFDRKPGQGYLVDPKDEASNLAICGSRCDDRDSSRQGFVTNGGWQPLQKHEGAKKIFITDKYSYDYEHNPGASQQAQAICGSRCNAMSDNLNSYLSPMDWRLIKIPGIHTRVINLTEPEVKGQCICRGDEYLAEPEYPDQK
jgi:hypothetical protein